MFICEQAEGPHGLSFKQTITVNDSPLVNGESFTSSTSAEVSQRSISQMTIITWIQ